MIKPGLKLLMGFIVSNSHKIVKIILIISCFQTTAEPPVMEEARMILHQQKILEFESVRPVGVSSLEVWWKFLGSRAYCEGLVIQYRERNKRYDQFLTVVLQETRSGSHVITNLRPDTDYDLFLQPYYSTIVGLPTSIRHIKTRTEEIVRKTEILVAEMINVTTAFIVWQPEHPSLGITGYQVISISLYSSTAVIDLNDSLPYITYYYLGVPLLHCRLQIIIGLEQPRAE